MASSLLGAGIKLQTVARRSQCVGRVYALVEP